MWGSGDNEPAVKSGLSFIGLLWWGQYLSKPQRQILHQATVDPDPGFLSSILAGIKGPGIVRVKIMLWAVLILASPSLSELTNVAARNNPLSPRVTHVDPSSHLTQASCQS